MSAVETGEMSETVCFFAYAGLLVTSTSCFEPPFGRSAFTWAE